MALKSWLEIRSSHVVSQFVLNLLFDRYQRYVSPTTNTHTTHFRQLTESLEFHLWRTAEQGWDWPVRQWGIRQTRIKSNTLCMRKNPSLLGFTLLFSVSLLFLPTNQNDSHNHTSSIHTRKLVKLGNVTLIATNKKGQKKYNYWQQTKQTQYQSTSRFKFWKWESLITLRSNKISVNRKRRSLSVVFLLWFKSKQAKCMYTTILVKFLFDCFHPLKKKKLCASRSSVALIFVSIFLLSKNEWVCTHYTRLRHRKILSQKERVHWHLKVAEDSYTT